MDNRKRIDTIYNLLKDLCIKQYRETGSVTGVPTKVICEKLSVQRTNASSDLNKLYKEGKIIKIKSNPALYKVSKETISKCISSKETSFDSIIGCDKSLKNAIQQAKAAILYPPNGLHTIILGETGTGKSLFAEQMYKYAKETSKLKADAPFIVFNCADYSNNPQLLMSHLFGVKKGAYTGATQDTQGLVQKAHDGILFLDEVHRLPPEGQEMLFYLIDKGQYRGLGESGQLHKVNLQIICATTENIESSLLKTFIRRIPMSINLPSLRERTSEERFELIKYFFMVEVATLHSDISVSRDAFSSLLFYQCANNIGQLRSDIKLACAKAYLKNMDNMNSSIIVELEDLSDSIKKDLIHQKDVNFNIDDHMGEIITFSTDGDNNSLIIDNRSPNLYEMLFTRKNILKSRGISEEDISFIVKKDIELYFKDYLKNINEESLDELYKIVDKQIVSIVMNFLVYAEEALDMVFNNKVLYGLSIHVASFIERSSRKKFFENTHLEDIRKNHSKEFKVSKKLKEAIENNFNITVPFDEVGFFSMFLYINYTETQPISSVGIVVAMHGDSAATSISEVANRLLGEANVKGYNMPLSEKPSVALTNILNLVTSLDQGKGVILMVDMGSLTWFGDMVYEKTGIVVKVIEMVSTPMVLEASRKALLGASIDEVYDAIINLSPFIGKVYRENIELDINTKDDIIITACITGKGTALKLKSILENKFNIIEKGIDVIPINISDKYDFRSKIKELKEKKNILAVVSSIDPEYKYVKYIPALDLLKGSSSNILDNKIFLTKNFDTINNMEEVLAENVDINSKKFIQIFKEFYTYLISIGIELNDNKLAGLILHLACLLERISKGETIEYKFDFKKAIENNKEKIMIVKQALNSLENSFKVSFSEEEYYNVAKVIYPM
ncbi:MAG: sigma 54-interacting transcriptional regulator [Clostridiaceae bacterium]